MGRRYGWPPKRFHKGTRIRYILENPTLNGQEGEIVSDAGVRDGTFNSAGHPWWEVQLDSGQILRFYEWAMEIVA